MPAPVLSSGILIGSLMAAAVIALANLEVLVPDTGSSPTATGIESVNHNRSIGQSFIADLDGLARIDILQPTAGHGPGGPLVFRLWEEENPKPIRTVTVPRDVLPDPEGGPWRFVPGRLDERWFPFSFEPVPDSAGKRFYFSLDGPDIPPESSVRLLIRFHSQFPGGQAYIDGFPVNAHLLFRAYSQSTLPILFGRVFGHMPTGRPGLLSEPGVYLALAVIHMILSAILLRSCWRVLKSSAGREEQVRDGPGRGIAELPVHINPPNRF